MAEEAEHGSGGAMPSPDRQGEQAALDPNPVSLFVSPGKDLAAKPGSHQDSWFLTSHLDSSRGPLDLLVHYLHVAPPQGGGAQLLVMVSVLESKAGKYRSEEQDFDAAECSLSSDRCEVITPIASCVGDPSSLNFKGSWSTAGISCDVTVAQAGPMLANMATGLWPALGGITYHYALPTMTTTGTVTIDGETVEVSGPSWLDRQWGTTPKFFAPTPKKWIWFSLVLDDGSRFSIWEMLEHDREHRFATIVHANGRHEVVAIEPLLENSARPWTSPDTGNTYPTRWKIAVPMIDAEFIVAPEVLEQEFKSPGGAHKYEASSAVTGTIRGRSVSGFSVIELVGDWK